LISTGELKKGLTLEIDGTVYQVLDYQHIKMGRGSAQVRLKLRDVRGGHTVEKTVQAGEKFARARVERHQMQYLYNDGELWHFMNTETYDQVALTRQQVGDAANYLTENALCEIVMYEDEPIGVELPTSVELTVVETEPWVKGDTAQGGSKPAKLETGLVVNVPLFVNTGDKVKVDTRTGEYLTRV
jgi:elongation factor P